MNYKIFRGWSSGDKVCTLLQLYPNCPFCPSFNRRHILGSIARYLRVDRLIFGYGILVDQKITIVYYYSQVYLIPTNLLIFLYISTIVYLCLQSLFYIQFNYVSGNCSIVLQFSYASGHYSIVLQFNYASCHYSIFLWFN